MKTSFTSKKVNLRHILYLSGLLLFLQSCSMEHLYLKGSIDDNAEVHSGPSYNGFSSPTGGDLGWNVGLVMLGMPEDPQNLRDYPGKSSLVPSQSFYASNLTGPAAFDYSSWDNGQQKSKPSKATTTDFVNHLTYMGGIEFDQKNLSDGGTKATLNYFEVPLYAIYYTQLGKGNIFGGLGPYFAYGIGGQTDSTPSFDSTSGFKRFDAGLGLTAGYKLPGSFYFNIGYSFGLTNIERNAFGDKTKNRGFSLNFGYPLAKLFKK